MSTKPLDPSKWNLFASVSRAMPVAMIAACGPVLGVDGGDSSGTDPTQPTDPSDPSDPSWPTDPSSPTDPTDPTSGACNDNGDCPYGYYCRDGVCEYECWCACGIAPPGELDVRCQPYYECYSDEECGPEMICEYGFCQDDPGCGALPVPQVLIDIAFSGTPAPVTALLFADAAPAAGDELLVARGAEVELVLGEVGTVVVQTTAPIVAMAAADLDIDGIVDLVTATADGDVQLWKGLGGGFAATAFAQPLPGVTAIAIGDRQGDGLPDVFARHDAGVVVFPGGPGAPLGAAELAVAASVGAIAVFDVDADGTTELVYSEGANLWLLDVGLEPQSIAAAEATAIVALVGADFSGDGVVDLAAIGDLPPSMATVVGPLGVGSAAIAPLGPVPTAATTGHLDDDGYADLAVGSVDSSAVRVRFGAPGVPPDVGPTEPFACATEYDVGLFPTALAFHRALFGDPIDLAATDGTIVRLLRLSQ